MFVIGQINASNSLYLVKDHLECLGQVILVADHTMVKCQPQQ